MEMPDYSKAGDTEYGQSSKYENKKNSKKKSKSDKSQKISFADEIPDQITLNSSETKQITLIQEKFSCKKYYLYRASLLKFDGVLHADQSFGRDSDQNRIISALAFKNTDQFLPSGYSYIARRNINGFGFDRVAVLKLQNVIPHQFFELALDPSVNFLDGSRKVVDFRHDQKAKFIKETVTIRIRARDIDLLKDSLDNIVAVDTLYRWNKYTIEASNFPHETRDDDPHTIAFNVSLSHNQPEKVIQYTVHYAL